jgi:hypothetical protein
MRHGINFNAVLDKPEQLEVIAKMQLLKAAISVINYSHFRDKSRTLLFIGYERIKLCESSLSKPLQE